MNKMYISEELHYKLLDSISKDTNIRANTRQNLRVTFTLLFYTGMRINEITHLKIKDLKEIIKTKELKILTTKIKKGRILYFSDRAVNDIKKLFNYEKESLNSYIIRSKGKLDKIPHHQTFINSVNKYMQKALNNKKYNSHSYRVGFINEMIMKGFHPETIAKFMGQDMRTIIRYIDLIKVDEDNLRKSIIR
jgi:integrase/recombinase XerD